MREYKEKDFSQFMMFMLKVGRQLRNYMEKNYMIFFKNFIKKENQRTFILVQTMFVKDKSMLRPKIQVLYQFSQAIMIEKILMKKILMKKVVMQKILIRIKINLFNGNSDIKQF